MHEFSLAQGLMNQLCQLADEHGATAIITVRVSIGRLSGIVADSFSFGFETLAGENSLTKKAALEITLTEPVQRCLDCRLVADFSTKTCPRCDSTRLSPEGGDELVLTQVEME
ncbi:MAG: hydrogenase maturation nickel metallochaperone HypA [Desulfobulbaceae bacterium]|nr:hydrogenase maturation nickel metallochaperone HypA [Desulfobulbaceae bacterium]